MSHFSLCGNPLTREQWPQSPEGFFMFLSAKGSVIVQKKYIEEFESGILTNQMIDVFPQNSQQEGYRQETWSSSASFIN